MKSPQHHIDHPLGLMLRIDLNEDFVPPNDFFLTNLARTIRSEMQALLPPQSHLALSLVTTDAIAQMRTRPADTAMRHSTTKATPGAAAQLHLVPAPQPQLFINRARDSVTLGNEPLHLTEKELQILNYLVDNAPRIMSREELVAKVWNSGKPAPSLRAVDVHVRRLRQRLGPASQNVRSARNKGYYFEHSKGTVVWELPEYSI